MWECGIRGSSNPYMLKARAVSDLFQVGAGLHQGCKTRKPVDCLLWVGNESLPLVKEFKYLTVLFTSEGVMGR